MIKLLRDDLGRIVGCCDVPRGTIGNHEYGDRDNDGVLHVYGIASVEPASKHGMRAVKWTLYDSNGDMSDLPMYEVA